MTEVGVVSPDDTSLLEAVEKINQTQKRVMLILAPKEVYISLRK
jgi:hypothetical protein